MFGFGSKQDQIDMLRMRVTDLEALTSKLQAQVDRADSAAVERAEPSMTQHLRGETKGTAKYTAIEGVKALLDYLDLEIHRRPAQDPKVELHKREDGDPFLKGRGSD